MKHLSGMIISEKLILAVIAKALLIYFDWLIFLRIQKLILVSFRKMMMLMEFQTTAYVFAVMNARHDGTTDIFYSCCESFFYSSF